MPFVVVDGSGAEVEPVSRYLRGRVRGVPEKEGER